MAGIVDSRARMWRLVAEVVSSPGEELATRLNSGTWIADVHEAVGWLGEAAQRFQPGLDAVTDCIAAAPVTAGGLNRGLEATVARDHASVAAAIEDLCVQLAAEQRAWSSGDDDHAKTLRLAQHDLLHSRMVPAVQQWCYAALHQRESPVLGSLAAVLATVLSMETGRDFERGMQGRDFRITDDIT